MKILLIFLVAFSLNLNAQINLQWHRIHDTVATGDFTNLVLTDGSNNIYSIDEHGTIIKYNAFGDTLFILLDTTSLFLPSDALIDHQNNLVIGGTAILPQGKQNIRIVKIDTSGIILWNTLINTQNFEREVANAITIDSNNNIYVTGSDLHTSGIGPVYTAKISNSGNYVWSKTFQGAYTPERHEGNDVLVVDSNNIFVIATIYDSQTKTSGVLIKYDATGNIVWHSPFNYDDYTNNNWGVLVTEGYKITSDSQGHIYAIYNRVSSPYRTVIRKYDYQSGYVIWTNTIDLNNQSRYIDIFVDHNSVYTGGTRGPSSYVFASISKLDKANGNIIADSIYWDNSLEKPSMAKHKDGFVIAGYNQGINGSERDYIVVRFDSTCAVNWHHFFSTVNSHISDEPYDIATDSLGGIYIVGSANAGLNDGVIYKLFDCNTINVNINNISNVLNASHYPTATYSWYDCQTDSLLLQGLDSTYFKPPSNGQYYLTINYNNCTDTTSCFNFIATDVVDNENKYDKVKIYPNPSKDYITITGLPSITNKISIYNSIGKHLKTYNTSKSIRINITSYPVGMYLLKVNNGFITRIIKSE